MARLAVVGEADAGALDAWVAWAPTVSVRRLIEGVGRAVAMRDLDPDGDWNHPELVTSTSEESIAQQLETRKMVIGASIYPGIIATMAIGVTVFLLTFVLPRFAGVFAVDCGVGPGHHQASLVAEQF